MPWASATTSTTAGRRPQSGGMWVSASGSIPAGTYTNPAPSPKSDEYSQPGVSTAFPTESADAAFPTEPADTAFSSEPADAAFPTESAEAVDGDPAAKLKALQRSDPVAREQWGFYCDSLGGGVRDPSKHPATFVESFLTDYSVGVRHEGFDREGQASNLTDFIKEGQRRSAKWKEAWGLYCQSYGGGKNDPLKHDRQFIIHFLDFLGQQGINAFSGAGGAPLRAADADRPQKRPRTSAPTGFPALVGFPPAGTPAFAAGSGDPEKDGLVSQVKAYQRSGEVQKQQWWTYCDERLGGVRDPAKHDKPTLQAFLAISVGV